MHCNFGQIQLGGRVVIRLTVDAIIVNKSLLRNDSVDPPPAPEFDFLEKPRGYFNWSVDTADDHRSGSAPINQRSAAITM